MAEASQQPKEWSRHFVPPRRDVGAALAALSEEDLLRLRAIARVRARSLPDDGMSWSDLRRHRRQHDLPAPHDRGGADDPERACAAAEALAAIQRLFASDNAALKVITALTSGMAAEDIRRQCGLTEVEYDTTRRRIRRTMLRHGLTWSWP